MLDPQLLEQYNAIVSYMEERFGRADTNGMQEILAQIEGMSVAVNIIQPSEEHPYLVLFTNGMSDLPMKVPAGHEDWQYGELMIQLPKEWVHPRESKGDPKWLWPVRWLRQMAYLPHLNETWLGRSATIATSEDPPVPLGPGTERSCLLLLADLGVFDQPLERPDGKHVRFYTMVPLFDSERDFELKHGMEKFLREFSASDVPLCVEVDRPSFA
ncbi:MAG: suppressor of fused domain protein [Planctomycetota bacterium]